MNKKMGDIALECFEEEAKKWFFVNPISEEEFEKIKKVYLSGFARGVEIVLDQWMEEIKKYDDRIDNTL